MITVSGWKRGNAGNELRYRKLFLEKLNVVEDCKKVMSSVAWEWDGEVGATVRAGARANEPFRKVEEEEEEKEE